MSSHCNSSSIETIVSDGLTEHMLIRTLELLVPKIPCHAIACAPVGCQKVLNTCVETVSALGPCSILKSAA
uniref:Uncharacterized protein n=1 Tax=Arundo donax TaxID=35708 RepID=A0A0A9AC47_ARUDO